MLPLTHLDSVCLPLAQTKCFSNISVLLSLAASWKTVWTWKKLFFDSSGLTCACLDQLNNVFNVSKLSLSAAQYEAVFPYLSLASNKLFLNSFRFSCTSLGNINIFSSNSKWPLLVTTCKAVYPSSVLSKKINLPYLALPKPNSIMSLTPLNFPFVLLGATRCIHTGLWLVTILSLHHLLSLALF